MKKIPHAFAALAVALAIVAICAPIAEKIRNKNFADVCREHSGVMEFDHGVPFCAREVK